MVFSGFAHIMVPCLLQVPPPRDRRLCALADPPRPGGAADRWPDDVRLVRGRGGRHEREVRGGGSG